MVHRPETDPPPPPAPSTAQEPPKYDYPFAECVTSQDYNGPYIPQDLIAAARATGGNYTKMAILLKRSRNGVYNACQAHVEVLEVLDEIKQIKLDGIEENQWALAVADKQVGQYMLDRLGKDRGFVTRQEASGPGGGPIQNVNYDIDTSDPIAASKAYQEMMNSGRS